MPFNPDIHHRRSIRLRNYDYSNAGAYFVTICVQNRECLFGDVVDGKMVVNEYGRVIAESWEWLANRYNYVVLDQWMVMPNHFHGIIIIIDSGRGCSRTAPTDNGNRKPLGRLIGAFKTVSTKRINQIRDTPGIPLWQRNYYEHIIRNDNELRDIREYIAHNPAGWLDDENHPDAPLR